MCAPEIYVVADEERVHRVRRARRPTLRPDQARIREAARRARARRLLDAAERLTAVRTGRDVAVFVRRRAELLLLRHARHGYWHVVAGVVEAGETFAVAARPELRAWTGLGPAG